VDAQRADDLPILQVLGQQRGRTRLERRFHDERVPIGEPRGGTPPDGSLYDAGGDIPDRQRAQVRDGAAHVVGGERPVIGLLPFALSGDGRAPIIHASRLARHTAGLAEGAPFDALVHEPVTGDVDPLQVRRVTLRGEVRAFAEHDAARAADRATYLAKFPQAEPITTLGGFTFFRL
jgi:hypothetical protein